MPVRSLSLALLAAMQLTGCERTGPPEIRTLPSGKQVSILSVTTTEAESAYRTLHVGYSTTLAGDDHVALAPEVDDVWALFQPQADEGDFDAVMISPHGGSSSDPKTTFPITRGEDGEWHAPWIVDLESGSRVLVVAAVTQNEALFVDYVSTLPIMDLCRVAPEVDEVWAHFVGIADVTQLPKAFVNPHETPLGRLVSFSFVRDSNGMWSRQTAADCEE